MAKREDLYEVRCPECNAACQVEEGLLTQRDNLYCQHCNKPLAIKYVEPTKVPSSERQPAPPSELERLATVIERLVERQPQGSDPRKAIMTAHLPSKKAIDIRRASFVSQREEVLNLIYDSVAMHLEKRRREVLVHLKMWLEEHREDSRIGGLGGMSWGTLEGFVNDAFYELERNGDMPIEVHYRSGLVHEIIKASGVQ